MHFLAVSFKNTFDRKDPMILDSPPLSLLTGVATFTILLGPLPLGIVSLVVLLGSPTSTKVSSLETLFGFPSGGALVAVASVAAAA